MLTKEVSNIIVNPNAEKRDVAARGKDRDGPTQPEDKDGQGAEHPLKRNKSACERH